MTTEETQDAPTLPDHRPAVAGQVERSVRPHVVPITLKQAREFVAAHHRHNKPPVGWKFGLGLQLGEALVGVATAGRPVARHYDDGCCIHCGFDGAEWHWWKHSTYEGRAQPEARRPLCKEHR